MTRAALSSWLLLVPLTLIAFREPNILGGSENVIQKTRKPQAAPATKQIATWRTPSQALGMRAEAPLVVSR